MQKFAPTTPTPPPGSGESCPSAEDLAAYIDGALPPAEMKQVEAHIASCEDCYNVYLGTVRFQLEHDPAPANPGEVVEFPTYHEKAALRARRLWWLSKAAAALVFAVLGLGSGGYFFLLAPPDLSTDRVAQPIQGREGLAESSWLGPTFRGSGEGGEAALDPVSFQLGVQLINLQVSLAANEGDRAQDVVARILQLLEGQLFVDDLKGGYTEITRAISRGTPPKDLLGGALELAGRTREALATTHLDLGQWVEAGRLSAIAQEPSFFQSKENRQFLRRLLRRQKIGFLRDMTIEPAALQSLQEISEVLDQPDLGPAEYAKLRQSFDEILEIYYPA